VIIRAQDNSESRWTAEEIEERLGISTAVYQKMRLGARQIAEIRQAGIKRIEISSIPHSFDYRVFSESVNHRKTKEQRKG
jgi:hypothetical protein